MSFLSNISNKPNEGLSELASQILFPREMESKKTSAELYAPNKMSQAPKEVHHQFDSSVERCYRFKPFESDEGHLECFFKYYGKMIIKYN